MHRCFAFAARLLRCQRRCLVVSLCLLSVGPAMGQVRSPQIGYCFPAGGQRGDTFRIV